MTQNNIHNNPYIDYPYLSLPDIDEKDIEQYRNSKSQIMIQKRYQHCTFDGVQWTPWMDYNKDDFQLSRLQKEEKWQLKPLLKNEYRIKLAETADI